jgi:hypothetical protein
VHDARSRMPPSAASARRYRLSQRRVDSHKSFRSTYIRRLSHRNDRPRRLIVHGPGGGSCPHASQPNISRVPRSSNLLREEHTRRAAFVVRVSAGTLLCSLLGTGGAGRACLAGHRAWLCARALIFGDGAYAACTCACAGQCPAASATLGTPPAGGRTTRDADVGGPRRHARPAGGMARVPTAVFPSSRAGSAIDTRVRCMHF